MKTVEQIADAIHAARTWTQKYKILKEWSESIVDTCAGSAEYVMEETGEIVVIGEDEYRPKHPVLVRSSILIVKEQLDKQ